MFRICFYDSCFNLASKPQEPSRPTYGCQVTIQTESEKKLSKLYRKEEKKMAKKQEEEEEYYKALGFNPQQLRAQRCIIYVLNMEVFVNFFRFYCCEFVN